MIFRYAKDYKGSSGYGGFFTKVINSKSRIGYLSFW